MSVRVPEFKEPGLTDFLIRVLEDRDRGREDYLKSKTANHSLLLISPGMKVYEIKVDDAGVISATLVAG